MKKNIVIIEEVSGELKVVGFDGATEFIAIDWGIVKPWLKEQAEIVQAELDYFKSIPDDQLWTLSKSKEDRYHELLLVGGYSCDEHRKLSKQLRVQKKNTHILAVAQIVALKQSGYLLSGGDIYTLKKLTSKAISLSYKGTSASTIDRILRELQLRFNGHLFNASELICGSKNMEIISETRRVANDKLSISEKYRQLNDLGGVTCSESSFKKAMIMENKLRRARRFLA